MILRFIRTSNRSQVYQLSTLALISILACVFVLQLALPVLADAGYVSTSDQEIPVSSASEHGNKTKSSSRSFRVGLFKSAVAFNDKPLADKTIERIKSQLKLQCIMDMNDQLVAYIHINGVGLKKCAVGDSINDMFTVLDINKNKKCVDVSIIDHKVTLFM